MEHTRGYRFFGLSEFIATGCFTGYLPQAPGTWGSWAACCLFWVFCGWFGLSTLFTSIIGCIVCIAVGVPTSRILMEASEDKDPPFIVIDEWAGSFITYSLVLFSPVNIICGFIFFRFFDIMKPWPIKMFETLQGGWGVVLDDVIAGIYASLSLFSLQFLL